MSAESGPSKSRGTTAAFVAGAAATAVTFGSPYTYMGWQQMTNPVHPNQQQTASAASAFEMSERLTDLKIAAVEAQTETKFAQLIGKLDLFGANITTLGQQVSNLDTKIDVIDGHVRNARSTIIAFVVGTGIAVAALAWAGIQLFQGGAGMTAAAYQTGFSAGQGNKQ